MTLFTEALERPDAASRAAYLDQACGGDAELRRRVEELLAAHPGIGQFLEPERTIDGMKNRTGTLAAEPATQSFDPDGTVTQRRAVGGGRPSPDSTPGTVIAGRYTLVEVIGEGGMGSVYLATQTEPVKRQVALKLIKTGMDSKGVLARFDAERQALALMDHPNIARIYDGGVTPGGQPFFVMELVRGVPLTEYCDQHRLTVDARLQLFVQVCQAVQHAHQKGIIHRDLKPGNVLVTEVDGKPTPKVIDFGVAKATELKLTDQSLSDTGAIVGTPAYMSPEQADPSSMDIDTRTDVYALGVMLYELLTGSPPIDSKQFKRGAILEMLRMVREVEPPRPSTKLSTADALPNIAASRNIEPAKLSKLLQGELDWVVMKALEKDRTRRYETANGLARDLQRFLADEVVEARPPSRGYRLKKFVKRNKGQVIAVSLVLLALVGGVVGTSIGMVQARRANADLTVEQAKVEARNKELAEQQAIVEARNKELAEEQAKVQARFDMAVKAIRTFHTGVSEDALLKNPQFQNLRTKLLKEAARFYSDLEKLLAGQTDAKSRKTLAIGYSQLADLTQKIGDMKEAVAVHRKALALRRELAAETGADVETRLEVARSLTSLAWILRQTGDPAGAIRAYEEVRDISAALEAQTPTDAISETLAGGYRGIGVVHYETGQSAKALDAYKQSVAILQKLADTNPINEQYQSTLASDYENVGSALLETGKQVEALEAYGIARVIKKKLADANVKDIGRQNQLAINYFNTGIRLGDEMNKPSEALEALRQARTFWQKIADDNPAVNVYQSHLAKCHTAIGWNLAKLEKSVEARQVLETARNIQQRLADANPTVTEYQVDLSYAIISLGALLDNVKPAEALEAYRQALAIQKKLVDANPSVLRFEFFLGICQHNIGVSLARLGRQAESLTAHEKARAILQKLADANPKNTEYQNNLAGVLLVVGDRQTELKKWPEALESYGCALAIWQKLADANPTFPTYQRELTRCLNNLGRLHPLQGRLAEAFATLDKAISIGQKLVAGNPTTSDFTSGLAYSHACRGWARVRAIQPDQATADLRKAIELWSKLTNLEIDTQVEQARTLALLAGLGGDAKSGVTKDEAKAFADQSVAALATVVKSGWALPRELKEPDFDAVREREDFKKLVEEMEAKVRMAAEPAPPPPEKK